MLRHVQKRGNSTVYEWKTGTEPSVVERPHLEEPPEQVEEDEVRQTFLRNPVRATCPQQTHSPNPVLNSESQREEREKLFERDIDRCTSKSVLLYFSVPF
jgi:hypothetical protein